MDIIIHLLVRVFGLIGLGSAIISFQFKQHKKIMTGKLISEVAYGVQYFLLGAMTGGIVSVVSIVRNYLMARFVEKGKSTMPLIVIFSLFVIVVCLWTWAGPISLFPLVSKVLSCVSYGMKDTRKLRFISLPTCFLWLVYNLTVGAFESAAGDVFSICSLCVAIYKFDIKKMEEPQAE